MSAQEELKNMILSFRVSELSDLLGFAGRNKTGKKQELQSRALDLLKLRSAPVQMKIHELHKRRFNSTGIDTQENMRSVKIPMNSSREVSSQAMAVQGRMLAGSGMNYRQQNMGYQPSQQKPMPLNIPCVPSSGSIPVHPDVQLKPLPFYDIITVLVKPSSLIPNGNSSFQENNFDFHLSPQQVTDIAHSKNFGSMNNEYINQIQLRFCMLETSCEQDDNFPPSILVKVNNKLCPLPNPIPTNRPGVEPKRPSRPVNITNICRLTATAANTVNVSWACEYGRSYVIAIYLVKKLDSMTLMSRLRRKGMRNPDHTRAMIKEKLTPSPDSEIATTSLRGSLLCPIGKKKMTEPCRPISCTHLQCFDADLFIKMNEKKPRWICPVCDKPAPFKMLAIDGLFSEISAKAPSACNEVQFHEDGSWTPIINDNDMTTHDVDNSSHRRILSPVKKKAKKESEVIDLTIDSDTEEEEWSSSSSVPPQTFKQTSPHEMSILPSTSNMMFSNKIPTLSNAPFIDLPSSRCNSPTVALYDVPSSPLPSAIGGTIKSAPIPEYATGQTSSFSKAPSSSTSSPRIKDSLLDLERFGENHNSNTQMLGAYPNVPYISPSPHYYSPVSTPPREDLVPSGPGYSGTNDGFDLFSLVGPGSETDELPRILNSGKSVPDVISLD